MSQTQCAARRENILGEGPRWDAARGRLYWLDIKGKRLEWIEPDGVGDGAVDLPVRASALAPRGDGSLLLATEAGFGVLDLDGGAFDLRLPVEPERPANRSNDGGVDLQGRFWTGTMDDAEEHRSGALYRLDADWSCERVLDGLAIPNTVAVSPDGGTFYLGDSKDQTIYAWDLDPSGVLGRQRVFADTKGTEASPDGSAVDAEGGVWNAQWGGWRVVRYRPDGTTDRVIPLPVEQPTSCAFGGKDLRTLYVTSARVGLSPEALAKQPLAGSLFAIRTEVAGLPLPDFAG